MSDNPKVAPKKGGHRGAPILDPVKVAAAVASLDGNLSAVARKFGVTRTAVQNMVRDSGDLQAILSDAREGVADDAESSLYKALRGGEAWAVCFFLKTQGRRRGYTERLDELPPLEVLLAALPSDVADVVRKSLAAALQSRPDPGGGPTPLP